MLVVWTLYELFDSIIGRLDLLPRDRGHGNSGADSVLRRQHIIPYLFTGDSSRKSNGLELLYRSDKEVTGAGVANYGWALVSRVIIHAGTTSLTATKDT